MVQTETKDPKRVFIIDDHAVVRDGYTMAINLKPDLTVCGTAGNSVEAVEQIPKCKPDVILMDLSLGDENGLDLIANLQTSIPDIPILVVSMYEESSQALASLRMGASGYVMKKDEMKKLIEGIHTVLRGEIYLSDDVRSKVLQKMLHESNDESSSIKNILTDRELEVFSLLGDGRTTHEIAKDLHVSSRTIDTHRERIRKKLKLKNAVQLHHRAFLWRQEGK